MEAAAVGVALSLLAGTVLGVTQALRVPGAAPAITGYVEAVRNTPELVQLFWVYLVLPRFGINLTINEAVFAYLTVNGTAYVAVVSRAAVLSVPRGQFEAAAALGLRGLRLYRRIILPQAMRKAVPSLVNQMIMVLKNTTLVSFIAAPDVVYYANHLSSLTMQPVPFQLYTGLMFFVVITSLAAAARRFENRGLLV